MERTAERRTRSQRKETESGKNTKDPQRASARAGTVGLE